MSLGEQTSPRILPKYQVSEEGQIGGAQASAQSCEAREANFVLFYRRPFEHDAIWIGTIAGLVGRPPTIRTGKATDITLALGDGISQPPEETLRFLRLSAVTARRHGGGSGCT